MCSTPGERMMKNGEDVCGEYKRRKRYRRYRKRSARIDYDNAEEEADAMEDDRGRTTS
jgi:hypothetical protein